MDPTKTPLLRVLPKLGVLPDPILHAPRGLPEFHVFSLKFMVFQGPETPVFPLLFNHFHIELV